MNDPVAAREALMIEAIGEVGHLIESVQELTPVLRSLSREITQANTLMRDTLGSFEARMNAITENAKTRTVQHLAARTDEATRRSIELHSRAMAEAARLALDSELGAALRRLHTAIQSLHQRRTRPWEWWVTHTAVAALASATTWTLSLQPWIP